MVFVASGPAACHSVVGDISGRCYVWGRNEKGQLGLGDTLNRTVPTLVGSLGGISIAGAACGRHHTVVFTDKGDSYSWGLNSMGQCGVGVVKKVKGGDDVLTEPQRVAAVAGVTAVAAGAEFTMWLAGGALSSAGLPQYGQLGHGDDRQYNASDSSVKMVFEPQPTPKPIAALGDKTVTRVACGHNHTLAVASDGGVWTWGFGGYGRLGHKVQQDEFRPRLVEALTGRIHIPADAVIAAGSTSSFCTMEGGQLFSWGKLKASGDTQMYPTPFYDLAGWNLASMACGATTFGVAAAAGGEKSVITWGQSGGYSELGYGPGGKKSSANPDKCPALEGVDCWAVALGVGHSLFLVDPEAPAVVGAPVYEPAKAVDDDAPTGDKGGAGGKRKAPAGKAAAGKKQR